MRIPLISAVILFVAAFLIDFYIAYDIKTIWKRKTYFKYYWVSAFLCWAFFIVIFCMPRREAGAGILPVMWMLYIFLSIYVAKFGYALCSIIGLLIGKLPGLKVYKFSNLAGIILGLSLCGIMWAGAAYNRRHIEVERVDVKSPLLPESFEGFKIVQISDLHVGTWGNDTSFVKQIVDSVNTLKPDLIVFTGDLVNRQTDELIPFLKTLSGLKSKKGVYSVLGNHDYGDYVDWENPELREENNRRLHELQRSMGWILLNNERIFISNGKDSIMVIGVENIGDPPFPTYGDLNLALSSSEDSVFHQNDHNFKILLSHNPDHWDRVVSEETNIPLTLSGHTHAMQALIKIGDWKWSPAKYRYDKWGGLYEKENSKGEKTQLYVNIGAGEVGMPARLLGAFPEITEITLSREN